MTIDDRMQALRGERRLRWFISTLLILAALSVLILLNAQTHQDERENAVRVKSDAVAVIQIPTVKQQITNTAQREHITHPVLASRGAGIPEVQPGPWEPFISTWYDGVGDGLNGTGTGLTATGEHVMTGMCAVDPSVIPLGSIIEVQFADGTRHILHATDTGGAIHGNRIDIYNPDRSVCMTKGRQHVRVRVMVRG